MIVYGLSTCDTCRKALKSLPDATLFDVRDRGFPKGLLPRALAAFGSALINTRSTTWRSLPESERTRPALELLNDHPALMKRPLIDDGGTLHLGWTPEVRQALGAA